MMDSSLAGALGMDKKKWYIQSDSMAQGPFDSDEIYSLYFDKKIRSDSLVWELGSPEWQNLDRCPPLWNAISGKSIEGYSQIKEEPLEQDFDSSIPPMPKLNTIGKMPKMPPAPKSLLRKWQEDKQESMLDLDASKLYQEEITDNDFEKAINDLQNKRSEYARPLPEESNSFIQSHSEQFEEPIQPPPIPEEVVPEVKAQTVQAEVETNSLNHADVYESSEFVDVEKILIEEDKRMVADEYSQPSNRFKKLLLGTTLFVFVSVFLGSFLFYRNHFVIENALNGTELSTKSSWLLPLLKESKPTFVILAETDKYLIVSNIPGRFNYRLVLDPIPGRVLSISKKTHNLAFEGQQFIGHLKALSLTESQELSEGSYHARIQVSLFGPVGILFNLVKFINPLREFMFGTITEREFSLETDVMLLKGTLTNWKEQQQKFNQEILAEVSMPISELTEKFKTLSSLCDQLQNFIEVLKDQNKNVKAVFLNEYAKKMAPVVQGMVPEKMIKSSRMPELPLLEVHFINLVKKFGENVVMAQETFGMQSKKRDFSPIFKSLQDVKIRSDKALGQLKELAPSLQN